LPRSVGKRDLPGGVDFVNTYDFASAVHKALDRHPEIYGSGLAVEGLRQWFRLHARTASFLAMPSRAVDVLWHEFIVDTVEYASFCENAYGRFIHHVPDSSMDPGRVAALNNLAMARTFRSACSDEGLLEAAGSPPRLPLLFAVDHKVGVRKRAWILQCGGDKNNCLRPFASRCVKHELLELALTARDA